MMCKQKHPSGLTCDVDYPKGNFLSHWHHARKNEQDYYWYNDSDILTSAADEQCIDILPWPEEPAKTTEAFTELYKDIDITADELLERGLPFVALFEVHGVIHRISNVFPRAKWQMHAAVLLEKAATIDELVVALLQIKARDILAIIGGYDEDICNDCMYPERYHRRAGDNERTCPSDPRPERT